MKRQATNTELFRSARTLLYDLSQSFSELEPYPDGGNYNNLASNKRQLEINGWPATEREFFISNFEFALAKAIVASGHDTGSSFVTYCRRVNREIDLLVETGILKRRMEFFPMLSTPKLSDILAILLATQTSLSHLFSNQGQERRFMVRRRPLSEEELDWYYFLKTYPPKNVTGSIGNDSQQNLIVNKFVLRGWGWLYYLFPIVIIFSGFWFYQHRRDLWILWLACGTVGISALLSFSLVMGIADTIAWPILHDPRTYNRMGFVPLHFSYLIIFVLLIEGRVKKSELDKREKI